MDREETNSYCIKENNGRIEGIPCWLQARLVSREIQGGDRCVQRKDGIIGILWLLEH